MSYDKRGVFLIQGCVVLVTKNATNRLIYAFYVPLTLDEVSNK